MHVYTVFLWRSYPGSAIFFSTHVNNSHEWRAFMLNCDYVVIFVSKILECP